MQTAELLVVPALSQEPHREVIQATFNHLTAAPLDRRFLEVLNHLVVFSEEVIQAVCFGVFVSPGFDPRCPRVALDKSIHGKNNVLFSFYHPQGRISCSTYGMM